MGFVDIHAHVLPMVDDGAESWDLSLAMLRQGEADGILKLIATPHILSLKDLENENRIISVFEELKARSADSGIRIVLRLGCELLLQPGFDFSRQIATLAGSDRYCLVEFPWDGIPEPLALDFFNMIPRHLQPIIAHPERNPRIIDDPSILNRFLDGGALLQITSGSLLGSFGKEVEKVALNLLDSNSAHIIASDAHDLDGRPLSLHAAYSLVCNRIGQYQADRLFFVNPNAVLEGAGLP
jgi:protein-tyrosine phosphatase